MKTVYVIGADEVDLIAMIHLKPKSWLDEKVIMTFPESEWVNQINHDLVDPTNVFFTVRDN